MHFLSKLNWRVSVPLRGLDMWKPPLPVAPRQDPFKVSVPLRGLDMWKPLAAIAKGIARVTLCFSPLAGIRYVETKRRESGRFYLFCFSPLAGIRYVETQINQSN